VTPRQAVLQKIWGSRGYDDLWELMGRESAARAADIAPELLREADACRQLNPDLASRLEQMGHAVSQVHKCVDQFAAVTNMAELLIDDFLLLPSEGTIKLLTRLRACPNARGTGNLEKFIKVNWLTP
jgi:hypothetical protein